MSGKEGERGGGERERSKGGEERDTHVVTKTPKANREIFDRDREKKQV